MELVAINDGEVPVRVQVFDSAQFIEKGGTVLDPLSLGNDAGFNVPAGGVQVKKVLTFNGHPADKATTATLAFNSLFWQGFGPNSLQVKGIRLRAME